MDLAHLRHTQSHTIVHALNGFDKPPPIPPCTYAGSSPVHFARQRTRVNETPSLLEWKATQGQNNELRSDLVY